MLKLSCPIRVFNVPLRSIYGTLMKRVVMIGSGNVATSLAHSLASCCEVVQVYSRRLAHARQLAEAIGCANVTSDLGELVPDADAYMPLLMSSLLLMTMVLCGYIPQAVSLSICLRVIAVALAYCGQCNLSPERW